MENNILTDSELKILFQEKKQPPKSDPLFTRRVMRRLPKSAPVKFLSPLIILTCAAAILLIFGLNFNMFVQEIGTLLANRQVHSVQILTVFIALISTFVFLIQQAIRSINE